MRQYSSARPELAQKCYPCSRYTLSLHPCVRARPVNGKFCDECLNQSWHTSVDDARRIIEVWRIDYNTVRPHSSLGYLTPEEYAAAVAVRAASPPTSVVSLTLAREQTDAQEPQSANL